MGSWNFLKSNLAEARFDFLPLCENNDGRSYQRRIQRFKGGGGYTQVEIGAAMRRVQHAHFVVVVFVLLFRFVLFFFVFFCARKKCTAGLGACSPRKFLRWWLESR